MTLVTGVCNRAKSHHNSSEVTGGWIVLRLAFELGPLSAHSNNLTSLVQ